MPDEQNQEKIEKPKGGTGKLLLFSGAGLAVVIAAAFLFATMAVPAAPEGGAGDPADGSVDAEGGLEKSTQFYEVRDIMVNVKGTNKKQILKTSLNLMYEADKPEIAAMVFEDKKVEIKNALNILLTGKTREELEGSQEMNMLAIELQDLLNRVVFSGGGGRIIKIYYDEFIIQ